MASRRRVCYEEMRDRNADRQAISGGDDSMAKDKRPYMDEQSWSDVRDGMRIDWDVPIAMDDGVVLRADIYRPVAEGKCAATSTGPTTTASTASS
jgi:predicted acyl esterase